MIAMIVVGRECRLTVRQQRQNPFVNDWIRRSNGIIRKTGCVRTVQNARLQADRRCEMVPDRFFGIVVEMKRFGSRQKGVEKIVPESTRLGFRAWVKE